MPFVGSDFFQAMAGQTDTVTVAYLKLLWHNWNHLSCAGLKDDDDYLRKIAQVDSADWPDVRAVLFDNDKGFILLDDVWHQKRQDDIWNKSKELYDKKCQQTEVARKARWKNRRK